MSDAIKHECGIALLHLKKPLSYFKEKYGTALYGINKMYLMMEKQHNRGQDGAGFSSIKLDLPPGQRYISRVRSNNNEPIQDIFKRINERIVSEIKLNSDLLNKPEDLKLKVPYVGEIMLGHVRYGTFGKNTIESVQPLLRQNNWKHRNLIIAGNFNMTNVSELFDNLVDLGQHPKEKSDTITVMEKIGHFLDDAVAKIYKKLKKEGYTKAETTPLIASRLDMSKVLLKASKNWDGGYAIAGMLGHGDSFVLRDPAGIRPTYFYEDEEFVAVASERPVIQTVFNVPFSKVKELDPGHAIITKIGENSKIIKILDKLPKKSCSFERIYFSRGSDAEIYKERKSLGRKIFPEVLKSIDSDLKNTVFSFIPYKSETSFYGMVDAAQEYIKNELLNAISKGSSPDTLKALASVKPRIEKIAIKDAKLRTFITEDSSRDDLVAHVYDITYGVIKPSDNLVIIDDSIVRGTTLEKSILKMLDRLEPKKIIIVSSAPQIRYPDCYGIDMSKLEDFIAFKAAIALHEDNGTKKSMLESIYKKCKNSITHNTQESENFVKDLYKPFTANQISNKIAELLSGNTLKSELKIIYQSIKNLHASCPSHTGDWYFSGDYPTPGGNKVVNRAFINFYEGKSKRAY